MRVHSRHTHLPNYARAERGGGRKIKRGRGRVRGGDGDTVDINALQILNKYAPNMKMS